MDAGSGADAAGGSVTCSLAFAGALLEPVLGVSATDVEAASTADVAAVADSAGTFGVRDEDAALAWVAEEVEPALCVAAADAEAASVACSLASAGASVESALCVAATGAEAAAVADSVGAGVRDGNCTLDASLAWVAEEVIDAGASVEPAKAAAAGAGVAEEVIGDFEGDAAADDAPVTGSGSPAEIGVLKEASVAAALSSSSCCCWKGMLNVCSLLAGSSSWTLP